MADQLTSMALSKKEAKKEMGAICSSSAEDGPKYPWGLTIELDDAAMKKLGITTVPTAGTTVTIQAKARVKRSSEEDRQDGTHCSMTLQVTDMAVDVAKGMGRARTLSKPSAPVAKAPAKPSKLRKV